MKRVLWRWLGMIAMVLLLSGCGGQRQADHLRVAVLPILDTLPLYVAEAEGYFESHGVHVELIPVASAAERDQLLQSGQVDVVITDLVALALYNRETTRVLAVRYAMVPTEDFAQFRVVASAQSSIIAADALRGVPIGISEGTVIEYVTVRMLEAEGLSAADIATLAVPKIPDRMALLNEGQLEAATLPEPLASLALQGGARVIVDDTRYPAVSCSLFAVRKDIADTAPQVVRDFMLAISQASARINGDKAQWHAMLVEKQLLPSSLVDNYVLPTYPENAVPNEAQWADVLAWLQETQRLMQSPAYQDVISAEFLPDD